MPVVEFCGRNGTQEGHLYEIQLSQHLTIVLDEQQAVDLCEALLDALPPQYDATAEDYDDKGDEWKTEGGQP